MALALTPYDNQSASKLVILDSSASESVVIESQDKIDAVSLYGDTAAILTDSTITGYSASSGNSSAQQRPAQMQEALLWRMKLPFMFWVSAKSVRQDFHRRNPCEVMQIVLY